MSDKELDLGPQPLIVVMGRWGLESHDLIEASPEQLTHKQVQRARSGRRLTLKMMMKVARSLNIAIWSRLDAERKERFVEYLHRDIFHIPRDSTRQRRMPICVSRFDFVRMPVPD